MPLRIYLAFSEPTFMVISDSLANLVTRGPAKTSLAPPLSIFLSLLASTGLSTSGSHLYANTRSAFSRSFSEPPALTSISAGKGLKLSTLLVRIAIRASFWTR
ncbi:MAG: hypothetical protein A4E56_01132 [Pelotomaculum sp. PtaU1.Bin065]|nr:MAG: hypothetical protein A4E56_01132 [Pelotomaculum sp. PtaU1.Bin065]